MSILTQKTINKPIHFSGVGLHTGKEVKMNIFPADPNSGIIFKRIDLNKNNIVIPNVYNVSKASFCTTISNEFGVEVLWTAKGTKDGRDYANTMNFIFKDTNMIHIHANMTTSINDTIQIMYSDDQTGIVIPENHMLMQAMLFEKSYDEAFNHTEKLFNLKEKKHLLAEHFAKKEN